MRSGFPLFSPEFDRSLYFRRIVSTRILSVISVIAVALGGWFFWSTHQREALEAPPPAPKVAAAPAIVKPAPPPPAPAVAKPWVALPMREGAPPRAQAAPAPAKKLTAADLTPPTAGTPVKEVLLSLRDAADQGIPQAACHLGVELLRCARIGQQFVALGTMQAAATKGQQDTPEGQRLMREAMAASQALGRDQRVCGDVPDDIVREGWRYVYAAAAAGNVTAMSRFVRDPGMDNTGSLGHQEAWAVYEREAIQFLSDAIQGGDIRALYHAWSLAVGSNTGRGTKIFPKHPDYAIAYATALRGLVDSWTENRIQRGTQASVAEVGRERAEAARQEGEKMREKYFANAKPIDKGNDDTVTDAADCWK